MQRKRERERERGERERGEREEREREREREERETRSRYTGNNLVFPFRSFLLSKKKIPLNPSVGRKKNLSLLLFFYPLPMSLL